jgi:hypothetical protein
MPEFPRPERRIFAARSLIDVAATGTDDEQLARAVREALDTA